MQKMENGKWKMSIIHYPFSSKGQVVLEYFVILAVIAVITIILLVGGPGNENKNIITSALDGYYDEAVKKIAP